MRVLHVSSSYPLETGDSTAPFMEEMLISLGEVGHEVSVVVPRVDGLVEGTRNGIRVVGAPYAPSRLQVWGYGRSLNARGQLSPAAIALTPAALASMWLKVRTLVRDDHPDVCHLHWLLPQGALSTVLPRSLPVVVSVHGADARFAQGLLRPIAARTLQRADAIIAASSQILSAVMAGDSAAIAKTHVITHGADGALFTPLSKSDTRRTLGISTERRVILAVGRLVRKKGFDILIEAIRLMPAQTVDVFIVGSGPELQRLERLVPSQIHDRVHFVGAQDRDAVALWFGASDVVAVPSIPDGRDLDSGPVVVMEGLAAGRPVVATDVGLARDVIEDGVNGYVIEPNSPAALAKALGKALTSHERLSENARRSFDHIGGWDRVADSLTGIYESVINARSSTG